ncbi:MAG: sigma 54-interacting transcriptional regulator [Planctomycetaceae bacterium]|nr:sigma 54-interacting transcriptional regulator [Planctomycetaceae bacterium]
MSPPRISSTELAHLLNSAERPIYVLDPDFAVVFLNRAGRDWLGVGDALLGCRCGYHSSPAATGLDAVAAGLCPPPSVLAGKTVEATVVRVAADGGRTERCAKFLPLGDVDDLFGVLAIVASTDETVTPASEPSSMQVEPDAIALHRLVQRFRQEAASRYRADRLIGNGPAIERARRQVELAAAGRASVLLVGPPGSGRQHLARAIHYGAGLHEFGMFTPLDCPLLGPDLPEMIAAALARGSSSDRPTQPGTLLLHRVDELPADLQVEAASLLVRRPIAWRLMATATEPLDELVRRGAFREDLAAALSTIVIVLPPLVERRGDLPLLAQLFLEELNAEGPRQVGGFTPAALDRLDGYDWPGNLAELAEVVAQSYRQAAGREIDVGDLPDRLRIAGQAAARPPRVEETIVLDEYLGRVERELIRRALAQAKGNKARAARLLGMTRPRLYRCMVQLGLE